jgi:hypothetical protein
MLEKSQTLVLYDNACRALAEAKSVDEVLNIRDKAEAARAYAKQAKNRLMELDAWELRVRAERRLGEVLKEMRRTKLLKGKPGTLPKIEITENLVQQHAAGKTYKQIGAELGVKQQTVFEAFKRFRKTGYFRPATLAELNVTPAEAKGADRLARMPIGTFDRGIGRWRELATDRGRLRAPLADVKATENILRDTRAKRPLDQSDPFDLFVLIGGVRIGDQRLGFLRGLYQKRLASDLSIVKQICKFLGNADTSALIRDLISPAKLKEFYEAFDGSKLQ